MFWTNDYEMLSTAAPAACTPATETPTASGDGQRRGSLSLPEIREQLTDLTVVVARAVIVKC